jgi:hypothetical protein
MLKNTNSKMLRTSAKIQEKGKEKNSDKCFLNQIPKLVKSSSFLKRQSKQILQEKDEKECKTTQKDGNTTPKNDQSNNSLDDEYQKAFLKNTENKECSESNIKFLDKDQLNNNEKSLLNQSIDNIKQSINAFRKKFTKSEMQNNEMQQEEEKYINDINCLSSSCSTIIINRNEQQKNENEFSSGQANNES